MNKKKGRDNAFFLSASIDFTAQHLSCKESINDPFGLLMLRAHSFAHPPFQSTSYPLSRVVVGGY